MKMFLLFFNYNCSFECSDQVVATLVFAQGAGRFEQIAKLFLVILLFQIDYQSHVK